jgi:hypothetical protein
MTGTEWNLATSTEQENKRLKAKVSALEHRLAVAAAAVRAAEHGRDVALRLAAKPNPWRRAVDGKTPGGAL